MQVLLRRESRKGGVILKNRCRFFFDGKKTRFSKMQMALGGEQAGTCFFYFFLSITIPNVNVDFAAQPWSKGRLAFFSIGLGLAFTSSAFLAFGPEKIVG